MTEHVHMKFVKVLATILGTWPVKLTGYKLKLYNAYFYANIMYYIVFNVSIAVPLFTSSEGIDFLEIIKYLNLFLIFVVNTYKALICKSDTVREIIQEIENKERNILENADEEIKQIYHRQAKSAMLLSYVNFGLGSVSIALFLIPPIMKNVMEEENELIYRSWFPFDSNNHYALAYTIQSYCAWCGYIIIVYGGTLFFSMLKFCIGQILILQHIFKNLHHYICKFAEGNNLAEGESHQMVYTKLCIKEHQCIISLVERFDSSVKMFTLLEFMTSSLQLSFLVFQLLQSDRFGIQSIAILSLISTIVAQLCLFYWNAGEIILQSSEIAQAVFECDWSSLDPKVQKMLIFVMMRAQKPVAISVGPIYKVNMDVLIGIFKAIYSYISLIQD